MHEHPLKVETRVRTPLGLLQVTGVFGVSFGHFGCVHRASIARDKQARAELSFGQQGRPR